MTAPGYDWEGFRALVREYERCLLTAPSTPFPEFARTSLRLLASLYREGTIQPTAGDVYSDTGGDPAWASRDEGFNPAFDAWLRNWPARAAALCAYLDEWGVPHADAIRLGSCSVVLGDAMADVLSDLQAGAMLFDEGRLPEAMWEWTFGFRHWGDHALGAMHCLHGRADG